MPISERWATIVTSPFSSMAEIDIGVENVSGVAAEAKENGRDPIWKPSTRPGHAAAALETIPSAEIHDLGDHIVSAADLIAARMR